MRRRRRRRCAAISPSRAFFNRRPSSNGEYAMTGIARRGSAAAPRARCRARPGGRAPGWPRTARPRRAPTSSSMSSTSKLDTPQRTILPSRAAARTPRPSPRAGCRRASAADRGRGDRCAAARGSSRTPRSRLRAGVVRIHLATRRRRVAAPADRLADDFLARRRRRTSRRCRSSVSPRSMPRAQRGHLARRALRARSPMRQVPSPSAGTRGAVGQDATVRMVDMHRA